MTQKAEEWAKKLAVAFQQWLTEHGYQRSQLAKELEIDNEVLRRIWRGVSVLTEHNEVYAKIFLRTKLIEADPRTIPPRQFGTSLKKRSWTNEEFGKWVERYGATYVGSPIPPIEQAAVKTETPELTQLINLLVEQLAEHLSNRLAEKLTVKNCPSDVSLLARALLAALQPAIEGTSEDRDRLFVNHMEALAELLPILDILTQNPDHREKALKTWRAGS